MPIEQPKRGSTLLDVARQHDRLVEETVDLANATYRHDRHIADGELLEWKRGRGMVSARSVSTTRGRESFLQYARAVIAIKRFA